ncbi:MAG: serine protease [Defluviitaleaceae bacterium]|nr:serine protease [Defluviitaleaceae bacterium]
MVPNQIIQKVIQIGYLNSTATAFTVQNKSVTKQFLVTAKHVFDSCEAKEFFIEVNKSTTWDKHKVRVHFVETSDIAVLELLDVHYITKAYDVPLNFEGIYFSQDVYFLGFPFGLSMPSANMSNDGLPFPLVKKACLSALHLENKPNLMLLDGINNKGFPGGPVCFKSVTTNNFEICGVISGFLPDEKGNNSGLIAAYRIDEVRKIIDNL